MTGGFLVNEGVLDVVLVVETDDENDAVAESECVVEYVAELVALGVRVRTRGRDAVLVPLVMVLDSQVRRGGSMNNVIFALHSPAPSRNDGDVSR